MNNLTTEELHILESQQPSPNGIPCPKCGAIMFDAKPIEMLTAYPTKKETLCKGCGYKSVRHV